MACRGCAEAAALVHDLAEHCCVCQSFVLPVVLRRLSDDIARLLLVRVGANQR